MQQCKFTQDNELVVTRPELLKEDVLCISEGVPARLPNMAS